MRNWLMAIIVLLVGASIVAAQPPAPREATLTVRGQGRVQVPPDHANLTAEVATNGKTAAAATEAHRARATRAVAALRARTKDGLEIEQSNFRLSEIRMPVPAGSPQKPEPEFQAVTAFELKIGKVDVVDRLVTEIASIGLFQLRNLRFGIDDKNPGLKRAREDAVADARERASNYAAAASVQLDGILRIDEGDFRSPREFAAAAPLARNVQVIPPENLTLSASVTMTWRIGARP
jgi:uncharacterized protein YggE